MFRFVSKNYWIIYVHPNIEGKIEEKIVQKIFNIKHNRTNYKVFNLIRNIKDSVR